MEIIEITGYTNDEKLHIAKEYIIRNKLEACGLKPEQVRTCILLVYTHIMLEKWY